MKILAIVCEGDSEEAYINRLRKYIEETTAPNVPLRIVPKNAHSGHFVVIRKKIKEVRKDNQRVRVEVMTDYDLYLRNDEANWEKYAARETSIPAFCFNFQNFEDFMVFHYPDEIVNEWMEVFNPMGHFSHPLHGEEYLEIFRTISVFSNYKKGSLPANFVNAQSLANLSRRIETAPLDYSAFVSDDVRSFAAFLLGELKRVAIPVGE